MDKFNLLVVLIQAYQNACKDFHYFCTSYCKHLLADEINSDDLYDTVDSIKENVFIAQGKDPLKAKEYAEAVAKAIPELKDTDEGNLKQLNELAKKISDLANSLKPDLRCANVLLDTVADKMAHAMTLLTIELRKGNVSEDLENNISEEVDILIKEAEEVIKVAHDHKAATETPVDRKEAKVANFDYDKVAAKVLDQEAQNLLVAEEDTLDKVVKKLGI